MFGDLHGEIFGEQNRALIHAVKNAHPDLILCPGDLLTAGDFSSLQVPVSLVKSLRKTAPVYIAPGNHESKLKAFRSCYQKYMNEIREAGGVMLRNRSVRVQLDEDRIRITGIELPLSKYRKFRVQTLSAEEMKAMAGSGHGDDYEILIAHNPAFMKQYLNWGADLIVSGHYHGGMVRLTEKQCLLSPYGFPLPRYGYGDYNKGFSHAVVTAGLGDHKIPFRINNPPEIVIIHMKSVVRHDSGS